MNQQRGMTIERFEAEYDAQPAWDVGAPQEFFVHTFSKRPPLSPVLEVGCGTGDLSIYMAELGCAVLGIDFAANAIEIATKKASEQHLALSFKTHDAFELEQLNQTFSSIVDCCFFHMLDDRARKRYAAIIHRLLKPGGLFYTLNFSVDLPSDNAPRGIGAYDILSTFSEGWSILELGASSVAVTFLENGLPGTFACIRKRAETQPTE